MRISPAGRPIAENENGLGLSPTGVAWNAFDKEPFQATPFEYERRERILAAAFFSQFSALGMVFATILAFGAFVFSGRRSPAGVAVACVVAASMPALLVAGATGLVSPLNQPPFAAQLAFFGVMAVGTLWRMTRSQGEHSSSTVGASQA